MWGDVVNVVFTICIFIVLSIQHERDNQQLLREAQAMIDSMYIRLRNLERKQK